MRAALPSDHDDDHGGATRWAAAGTGHGNRLGTQAAVGPHYRRRLDCQSGADPVHHTCRVSLHGPFAPAVEPQASLVARTIPGHEPRGLNHSFFLSFLGIQHSDSTLVHATN